VIAPLQRVPEASPCGELTFLVTEFGQPFSADSFGNWLRGRCDEAELPQCSAHGLRKAGAALAAENSASARELIAIFGWLTMKEAECYTQAARRRRLARNAGELLVRRMHETSPRSLDGLPRKPEATD